jgi:hypothetical protein
MPVRVPGRVLEDTFAQFRHCGAGRRECQALWVGPWSDPEMVTTLVHPHHSASAVSFELNEDWFNAFWVRLADENMGVRVQVHTHPGAAFHSSIDDENPVVATPGFLSLVIPNFAAGPVGFDNAFLAQIDASGNWSQVPIDEHLEVL